MVRQFFLYNFPNYTTLQDALFLWQKRIKIEFKSAKTHFNMTREQTGKKSALDLFHRVQK